MEIDDPSESTKCMEIVTANGSKGSSSEIRCDLTPVSASESGEGLPYAPINWPNPGDNWCWKVGRRVSQSGHYLDRYLVPPKRFVKATDKRRRGNFDSKLVVQNFIKREFPGADIDAFFASFSWKIPAKGHAKGHKQMHSSFSLLTEGISEESKFDSQSKPLGCKAGNVKCSGLIVESAINPPFTTMFCDVCCGESNFCRDCCCILCCKTIDSTYRGYSFIKCEAIVAEGFICGHMAHLDCSLRSYMAGTVGGNVGLDAEYHCRRCDARTDLVPHVIKILRTCESIDSEDEIEKILNVAFCILRGSKRTNAKMLMNQIEEGKRKLKCVTNPEDISKVVDIIPVTSEMDHHERDAPVTGPGLTTATLPGYTIETLRLEDEIDEVLMALRKSQENEYRIAEEMLHAQKDYLLCLHQQLEKEKMELAMHTSSTHSDVLLDAVLNRRDQLKREVMKLKDMEKVAKGFGITSKGILKEHFGLEIED